MIDPNTLVGPFGVLFVLAALVGALAKAIQALWKVHLLSDQDDRDTRDRAITLLEAMAPTLKELAEGQAAANRDAVERHRRDDR